VKLNFGLSPDFSVQLKVSLSERLSQKLKSPTVLQEYNYSWMYRTNCHVVRSIHWYLT